MLPSPGVHPSCENTWAMHSQPHPRPAHFLLTSDMRSVLKSSFTETDFYVPHNLPVASDFGECSFVNIFKLWKVYTRVHFVVVNTVGCSIP